jgi:LysR family transcriptional regulator, regulator of abg operon
MKLANLKALSVAIETGSLRNAARRLGLSQPALTKAIRELEIELGTSLLVRSTRGVQPTAQGQILTQRAMNIDRELHLAIDEIRQLSGHMQGELSIGAVPLAVLLLIPETLRTFGQEFPDVRLRISEELYMAQLQRLRKGEVDVAIGGVPKNLPGGEFVTEPLLDTTMVVVAKRGSKHASAKSLADLTDAKWVYTAVPDEQGYARLLYDAHALPAPRVGAVVNSTLTLLSLVASADYIALMPEQVMRHPALNEAVRVVPIQEKGLKLSVGAMVRSDVSVTPLLRQFLTHLQRAAHQVQMGRLPWR